MLLNIGWQFNCDKYQHYFTILSRNPGNTFITSSLLGPPPHPCRICEAGAHSDSLSGCGSELMSDIQDVRSIPIVFLALSPLTFQYTPSISDKLWHVRFVCLFLPQMPFISLYKLVMKLILLKLPLYVYSLQILISLGILLTSPI
jgi:hypothetical protein